MTDYFLCNNTDIENNKAKSIELDTSEGKLDLFAIKVDDSVHAYINNCPHLGIPLNWQPDEFLSIEETHIQCSTHGALFTMEEGDCIAGPCRGQSLEKLTVELRDDNAIWIKR